MQITCLGAAGQVTGSCFLLENGNKYLIDCGLFQGGKHMEALNQAKWPFHPGDISTLFLTHAHIDHSGRIPRLVRDGFRGKILATIPTAELCKILLLDSAHIQEMEAEWQTRRSRRRGGGESEPLYTIADAERTFPLLQPVAIDATIPLDPHVSVRFRDAGHILGSSILEVWCANGANSHKIVFSGDLGRKDQLIVKDPHRVFDADTLFIESTYGNRNHKSFEESKAELLEAIRYSIERGEKVLIPAFAVERTQELLYILGGFFREKLIPSIPVYLDSPLAIAATEIFRRMQAFYDEDALDLLSKGYQPFDFPQLILSRATRDSMAINEKPGPAVIIAGNGMCTAGRIMHHLKHNIWRKGVSLVIAGFQAEGTLGRKIVDGAKSVRIFGEEMVVRAKLFTIGGFSAHAGQADLLEWIGNFKNPRMKVFVIHGERAVSEEFAGLIHSRYGFEAHTPAIGDRIDLGPVEERAVVREEREKPKWQQRMEDVTRKMQEIDALWKSSPECVSGELVDDMERELAKAQAALDTLLRRAGTRAG